MAQQTAVEFLIEEIHKNMGVWIPTHIQEQAKAMEKEQVKNRHKYAEDLIQDEDKDGGEYYNETYNK